MYTISVATSKDRVAITAVEILDIIGKRDPLRVVTYADRLPPEADPGVQHAAVTALSDAIKEQNGGEEPRVVLMYGGSGTTLWELLREDYRQDRRRRRPTAISTASGATDGAAQYVSRARLAAILYKEWTARRIRFASGMPGIERLRGQMSAFTPKETSAGNLKFGDESMDLYDDQVVSLMLGVLTWGAGDRRVIDAAGDVWPSMAVARQHIGSATQQANAVTHDTTYGAIRVVRP